MRSVESCSEDSFPKNKEAPFKDGEQMTNRQQKEKEKYFKQKRYILGNNIFQILFFSWISPLLTYGNHLSIEENAIPHLRDKHKPIVYFNNLLEKFNVNSLNKSKRKGVTLAKTIFSTFKKEFFITVAISLSGTAVQMLQSVLSHNVIDYIADEEKIRTLEKDLFYFITILTFSFFLCVSNSFIWYYFNIIGYNVSNTLSLAIFYKSLKHPFISEKKFSSAKIINFSQVDAQRMSDIGIQIINAVFYAPLQIAIGFTLLYIYIGISFLVGIGIMIVLFFVTMIFTKIAAKGNDDLLKAKDARMKVAEEILHIIKFIKINVLEKHFYNKINSKREEELKLIRKVGLCTVAEIFIYWLIPPLIISSTFLVYIALGNTITAAKAFFTIIIFNTLAYPLQMLPEALSEMIQIWSSLKRIESFLLSSELNHNCIKSSSNKSEYAVEISNGNFLWGKERKEEEDEDNEEETKKEDKKKKHQNEKNKEVMESETCKENLRESLLTDNETIIFSNNDFDNQETNSEYIKALSQINIKVPSSSVTMIIGDIGSGKSSLLYAILNEMTQEPNNNAEIKINGSIAYVPQKAWIMAGTVKENILFFQPLDENRLKEVIHFSCLEDDLKILNKGVKTEIGEKGVNLSGGQKARISLARALYSNRNIYLLDDVLSAVDVHVGKFLMEVTILEYLKGKTVIMPTHAIKYLEKADNIIIMKKGRIVTTGKYHEIVNSEEFEEIVKLEEKNEKTKAKGDEKLSKEDQEANDELRLIKESENLIMEKEKSKEHVKDISKTTDEIVEQLILPEDHHKGEVSIDVYIEYIKQNGGALFVSSIIFLMSAWAVLAVYSNIQIERWCEDETKDIKYLYLYLVLAISATLFSGIRAYILCVSGIRQGRNAHKQVIKALLYTSLTQFYNRVPIGRILNRLSKDLREVDETLGYSIGGLLVSLFCMMCSLFMCVYASTPFVILPIIIMLIICRFMLRYFLKTERECVRIENITNSPIVSGFTSAINGVGTIRAFGLTQNFLEHQIESIEMNKRTKVTKEALLSWFEQRLGLLSIGINMIALGYAILSGNDNASLAGLLLTYSGFLTEDIIGFVFNYSELEIKMISVERVNAFTKLEAEPGYLDYCKNWEENEEGNDTVAINEGSISIKQFSARYREDLPLVIKDISLEINKGEKVGIVGRTGAGKSTFMNCLLRIVEAAEGKIEIDGKNITLYQLKDLRSCITMIEQEPTLIEGSFRENLDHAGQYKDEEIMKILESCNLKELVKEKGGLEEKITNDTLSVGEKQLLCICRAFLKHSRIILIDEATANIDVKNDRLIQNIIGSMFEKSTVLTIAHRLSTLEKCDKILVLGEGRVLEWGSRKELLEKEEGIYRGMCMENDTSYLT